jgi:hypothetical protein
MQTMYVTLQLSYVNLGHFVCILCINVITVNLFVSIVYKFNYC